MAHFAFELLFSNITFKIDIKYLLKKNHFHDYTNATLKVALINLVFQVILIFKCSFLFENQERENCINLFTPLMSETTVNSGPTEFRTQNSI